MKQTSRIVVVSDLHVNSTVGLWPPEFVRDGGAEVPQSRFQRWLWACWLDFCKKMRRIGPHIVVFNGDPIQGCRSSRDVQLMLANETDMLKAAKEVCTPLAESAQAAYFVRGTEWHDGVGGKDAEALASMVKGVTKDRDAQYSRWTLRMELDSKLFAFAHHTSVARVNRSQPAARTFREAKERLADKKTPVPDVIVRSHVHHWGFYPDDCGRLFITTPGWQLPNAFTHKIAPEDLPDIGGVVLWVENDTVRFEKYLYQIPLDKPVILR